MRSESVAITRDVEGEAPLYTNRSHLMLDHMDHYIGHVYSHVQTTVQAPSTKDKHHLLS